MRRVSAGRIRRARRALRRDPPIRRGAMRARVDQLRRPTVVERPVVVVLAMWGAPMMCYACTCGEWHSLAYVERCDRGVPTTDSLDLIVDVVDTIASAVGFPLEEWQRDLLTRATARPASQSERVDRAYPIGASDV